MILLKPQRYYSGGSWLYTDANNDSLFKTMDGLGNALQTIGATASALDGIFGLRNFNNMNSFNKLADKAYLESLNNSSSNPLPDVVDDANMGAEGGRLFPNGGFADLNGLGKTAAIVSAANTALNGFKSGVTSLYDTNKVNAAKLNAQNKYLANKATYNSFDSIEEAAKHLTDLNPYISKKDITGSTGNKILNALSSIGSGALTGATFGGSAGGPIGAAIGATAGLLVNGIGQLVGSHKATKDADRFKRLNRGLNLMGKLNLNANANRIDRLQDLRRARGNVRAEGGEIETALNDGSLLNSYANGGLVVTPSAIDTALGMQAYNSAVNRATTPVMPNNMNTYMQNVVNPLKSFDEGGKLYKDVETLLNLKDIHGDNLNLSNGLEIEVSDEVYKALVNAGVDVSRIG